MSPTRRSLTTIPARTTTDLIAYAEQQDITVIWAANLPERARWIEGVKIIVLRYGMTERRTVSTFAHELAHHHYGDVCGFTSEARAWRWAARLLIPDHDYAEAETMDPSPGGLARHLGVTVDVIHAYQEAA